MGEMMLSIKASRPKTAPARHRPSSAGRASLMGLVGGGSRPGSASGSSEPGSADGLRRLTSAKTVAMQMADKARNRKSMALQQAGIALPARPTTAPADAEPFYGDPENPFHNKRMSFGFVEAARPMTPSVQKHLEKTAEYKKKQAQIEKMKSHNRKTIMKRQSLIKRTVTTDPKDATSAEFTHDFQELTVEEQAEIIITQVEDLYGPAGRALAELYHDWDGLHWKVKFGWLRTSKVSKWHGVTTCAMPRALIGLQLPSNNLVGTIPENLPNMTGLTMLDLSGNNLTGELPLMLSSLHALETLDLSNNRLHGMLPEGVFGIDGMPVLGHLNLSMNHLGGTFTPSIMKKITALKSNGSIADLSMNDPGFKLPVKMEVWQQLADIKDINMFNCSINGSIPEGITTLTHLETIRLWGNQLSGEIPEGLEHLHHLEFLILHLNQLSGEFPEALFETLLTVDYYDFRGNQQFSSPDPHSVESRLITKCTHLRTVRKIDIKNQHLVGILPPELGYLPDLRMLDIRYNNLTGPIPFVLNMRASQESPVGRINLLLENSAGPEDQVKPLPHLVDQCLFPMFVIDRESFLEMHTMESHEEVWRRENIFQVVGMPVQFKRFQLRRLTSKVEEQEVRTCGRQDIVFLSHVWYDYEENDPDDHNHSMLGLMKIIVKNRPDFKYIWTSYVSMPQVDRLLIDSKYNKLALRSSLYYAKCCETIYAVCHSSKKPFTVEDYLRNPWGRLDRILSMAPYHSGKTLEEDKPGKGKGGRDLRVEEEKASKPEDMTEEEEMAYLLEQEEKERLLQLKLEAKRRSLWVPREHEGKIMCFDARQGRMVEERFEGLPLSPIAADIEFNGEQQKAAVKEVMQKARHSFASAGLPKHHQVLEMLEDELDDKRTKIQHGGARGKKKPKSRQVWEPPATK